MKRERHLNWVKRLWSEALPFVAKSQEMQIAWLVAALKKGALAPAELTPYLRLLLMEDVWEQSEESAVAESAGGLALLLAEVEPELVTRMLECADFYDLPKLVRLIPTPTLAQATITLRKSPPPYEKNVLIACHRLLQAIHARSPQLLEEAAAQLARSGVLPVYFAEAYAQFREILRDEAFLSSMYPKAKM